MGILTISILNFCKTYKFYMVNFSILISNSEVTGPGGLFDIDATLPLVAIQFLLLMVILNVILYSPLLSVITERNEYILNNLAKASEILEIELNISQKYIDNLLDTITADLLNKKETALNSLDTIVQSLCVEIETRLSI